MAAAHVVAPFLLLAGTGTLPDHPMRMLSVAHPCYAETELEANMGTPHLMDTNSENELFAYRTAGGIAILGVMVADGIVCIIWSGPDNGKGA